MIILNDTILFRLLSSRLLCKNLKIRIYKITVLPVVLYGCETCSLTLREDPRLRVFENRALRRIFGHKREEVVGGVWRVARLAEVRNAYKILVGKHAGKRALGSRLLILPLGSLTQFVCGTRLLMPSHVAHLVTHFSWHLYRLTTFRVSLPTSCFRKLGNLLPVRASWSHFVCSVHSDVQK
jgi:hypothetical protein